MPRSNKPEVTLASLGIDPADATIVNPPGTNIRLVVTRDKRVFNMRWGRQCPIRYMRNLTVRICVQNTRRDIPLIGYWNDAFAEAHEYPLIPSKDKLDLSDVGAPGLAVTRDGRFWDLVALKWCVPRWTNSSEKGRKYLVAWSQRVGQSAIVLYAKAFVPNPNDYVSAVFVDSEHEYLSPVTVVWVPTNRAATRRSKMGDAVAVQICTEVIIHGKTIREVATAFNVHSGSVENVLLGKCYGFSTAAIRAMRSAEFDRMPEEHKLDLARYGAPGLFLTYDGRVWNGPLQVWQTPASRTRTALIRLSSHRPVIQINATQVWAERWLPNPHGWSYAQFVDPANPVFSTTTIHWVKTRWGDTDDQLQGRGLTDGTVRKIREAWAAGHESQKEIARRFGVTRTQCGNIIHRRMYRDVK